MQVNGSDTQQITISDTALKHIAQQLEQTQATYLRLGVKQSGCNGYMYMLDYLEDKSSEDMCFSFDESVQVCVSETDMPMVAGTEIDMITEGLNSALVFKNSKATSYCGCGESFAVGGEPPEAVEDAGNLDPNSLGTPVTGA